MTHAGNTEFIWITVTGIEGDRVYGTLGNDPGNLGSLKFGSKVSVLVADLNDWCYIGRRWQIHGRIHGRGHSEGPAAGSTALIGPAVTGGPATAGSMGSHESLVIALTREHGLALSLARRWRFCGQ